MPGRRKATCGALLAAALLPLSTLAADDTPPPPAPPAHHIDTAASQNRGVGQNFDMVEKLLHESASAQRILQQGDERARQLHSEALQALQQARAARDSGDSAGADQHLQQAKRLFFQALQLAGAGQARQDQLANFTTRLHQVQTMLDAYKQVLAEQGVAADKEDISADMNRQLLQAQTQARDGDLAAAGQQLEQTWLTIRLALVKLRDGKTLVRRLEFASKEEEYAYELDRNNTHFMLLQILLGEKQPAADALARITAATDQARTLREQAQQQAATGNHEAAIKTLDDSTREIIRGIRAAGIYIPG